MNITVKTNMDIFYNQLLELFSSFNPIKDLRKSDKTVLAEIMSQNYKYRHLKNSIRRNTVFSQEVKKEMCDNLDIPRTSFNNSLSALRKRKVLKADNTLIKPLNIFPEDLFKFEVTFNIENEEKTEGTGV